MPFKLHFFKNQPAVTSTGKSKHKISFPGFLAGLLFILIVSFLLYSPREKIHIDTSLHVGDISKEDIIIGKPITVEDKEQTAEKRKRALENVIPIYEYSPENQIKSIDLITWWFQFIRDARKEYSKNGESQKFLVSLKTQIETQVKLELSENEIRIILETQLFNKIDLDQLIVFVKTLFDKKVVNSIPGAAKSKDGKIQVAFKNSSPITLEINKLYDLKTAREALVEFLKQQPLSFTTGEFIASILKEFLNENIVYSIPLSKKEEQKVTEEVKPVLTTFKAGKVIIRKGDEVKPKHIKIFKMLSEKNKLGEQKLPDFFLVALVMFFLSLFGRKFFDMWVSTGINKDRLYAVFGATLLLGVIIYKISLFMFPLILKNINLEIPYDANSVYYALPFGFGVLTIAFIFNLQSAVIFSFVNALTGGILCGWDITVFLFILLLFVAIYNQDSPIKCI